jgi:hypothetical protein
MIFLFISRRQNLFCVVSLPPFDKECRTSHFVLRLKWEASALITTFALVADGAVNIVCRAALSHAALVVQSPQPG